MTFYAANPQDGKLFKLASDRGFLTYTGTYAGERLGVASGGRFVSPWVLREVLEGFQKNKMRTIDKATNHLGVDRAIFDVLFDFVSNLFFVGGCFYSTEMGMICDDQRIPKFGRIVVA